MKKRYQVFVSSTFEDLKEERSKVMETVLNNDCVPAGMEMFPAMDEEQFEYIKRIIDDSDYYLLIIGGRYGSADDKGVSWTEKEFDYAVSKGIHVMAFVMDDVAYKKLPQDKLDKKDIDLNRERLKKFKEKVSTKRLIRKWSNADQLSLMVSNSLKKVLEIHPGIGWVRANEVTSGDAQKEIDRLQKEIEAYKNDLNKLKEDLKEKEDEKYILEASYQEVKSTIKKLKTELRRILAMTNTPTDTHIELTSRELSFEVNGVRFNMVRVEGGAFMMGADDKDEEAWNEEKPAHRVNLSDFWIGKTQVTQKLWEAVMKNNPSKFTGDLNRPVEQVNWFECKDFIKNLNVLLRERLAVLGLEFSLPTEAQWEFAARGGNLGKENGFKFSGSNNINDVAWFIGNSNEETHPVAKGKKKNELGLFDMSGNVWEWCEDKFAAFSSDEQFDPFGPKNGTERVRRGGGRLSDDRRCRVSTRNHVKPNQSDSSLGLRLALTHISL